VARSVGLALATFIGFLAVACAAAATQTPSIGISPSPSPTPDPNLLRTIAGGGHLLGDGGPATGAGFCAPVDVAVDAEGNVYVADVGLLCSGPGGHRIRRIDRNGVISTVAGTGVAGFSGDGGPATEAQLNTPMSIAIDDLGNLYISDLGNSRIRRVDSNGTITTFAGNGERGSAGDNGPAIEANLFPDVRGWFYPGGIAFDADGNMYIADGAAVRRIDTSGTITTVTNQPILPYDVGVDGSGNVYVTDWDSRTVFKVDTGGNVTTLAGGANAISTADGIPATKAFVTDPWGIAVSSDGDVFVGQHHANRIRRISPDGMITTVAGRLNPSSGGGGEFNGDEGPATEIDLNEPIGLFVDEVGDLYIADTFNARVRKVHFAQPLE
jgi:sugar lactone lactonase YvrE